MTRTLGLEEGGGIGVEEPYGASHLKSSRPTLSPKALKRCINNSTTVSHPLNRGIGLNLSISVYEDNPTVG